MSITAKVTCNLKHVYGTGQHRSTTLGFMPDYTDGRNQEWSHATPHLDLRMTVRGDVGDRFEPGRSYVLLFTEPLDEPGQGR